MNDCKNMYLINDVIVLIKAFKHFRELTEKKWCVSQVVLDSQSSKQRLCIKYIKKKRRKDSSNVAGNEESNSSFLALQNCQNVQNWNRQFVPT